MSHSVFISKPEQELEELRNYLQNREITLVAHSFLSFERVEAVRPDSFDCIFFGSPRSAIFYSSRNSIPANVKVACSGNKTAEVLTGLGHTPDFVAQQSGNIDETSLQFADWCGDATVLFALSETSNKSYTKHLHSENVLEMVVYRTLVTSKRIPDCAIYAFSSPSNVEGFLKENSFPPGAKIIAWGQTTEKSIKKHGFTCDHVLSNSSEQDLIRQLEAIL